MRLSVPFWELSVPTFVVLRRPTLSPTLDEGRLRLGGRCQWVLDAIYQMVEWLSQPLRFDSVVLRTTARPNLNQGFVIISFGGWRTDWQYPPRMTTGAFDFLVQASNPSNREGARVRMLTSADAHAQQYRPLLYCRQSSGEPRLLPVQARL